MNNNNIKTVQGVDRQDAFLKAKEQYGDNFSLISVREIKKNLFEMVILLDESSTPQVKSVPNNPYNNMSNLKVNDQISNKLNNQKQKNILQNNTNQIQDAKKETRRLSQEIHKILEEEGITSDILKDEEKDKKSKLSPHLTNIESFLNEQEKEKKALKKSIEVKEKEASPTETKTLHEIEKMKTDISKLIGTLNSLQGMFLEEKGYSTKDLVLPPEFAEIFHTLKASGILKRHLDEIFKNCIQNMPIKMKENPLTVERYFRTLLNNMILTRQESSIISKRKIVMLVGPTGVGKTTSVAKIAARYCFSGDKNKRNNVGIITLDDYRLGALDQIMTYAKIMQLSIQAVVNPTEFVSAINSLNKCDYILIDTAGSSPYNKTQIASIKKFLEEDETLDISVSLVMATNIQGDVMEDIFNNFSVLDVDTLILTKLDETRKFGPLFSFLFDHKKPISYFSIGQEVPDDIRKADKNYLINHLFTSQ